MLEKRALTIHERNGGSLQRTVSVIALPRPAVEVPGSSAFLKLKTAAQSAVHIEPAVSRQIICLGTSDVQRPVFSGESPIRPNGLTETGTVSLHGIRQVDLLSADIFAGH